MTTKDQENESLVETLDQREAGVRDLFEFYAGVEATYASSVQALEDGYTVVTSDSTNRR
ncbi:hypothetical protein ACFLST_00055 [Chloroflexota bacterium]